MSEEHIKDLYVLIPVPDDGEVGEMAAVIAETCLSFRQAYLNGGWTSLPSTFLPPSTICMCFKKSSLTVRIYLRPE